MPHHHLRAFTRLLPALLLILACGAAQQQVSPSVTGEAPAVAAAPAPDPARVQGPAPLAARMAIEPQVLEWGATLEVGPAQAMCDGLIHGARVACYEQLPAAFIRAGRLEVAGALCPVATFHSFSCYGVVVDAYLSKGDAAGADAYCDGLRRGRRTNCRAALSRAYGARGEIREGLARCAGEPQALKRACYRSLGRGVLSVDDASPAALCEGLAGEILAACVGGVADACRLSGRLDLARALCDRLDAGARAACLATVAEAHATEGQLDEAVAMCRALDEGTSACLEGLAATLKKHDREKELERLCGEAPAACE